MITVTISKTPISRQWRWTARGGNGEIIATSGRESYGNYADLMDTLRLLFSSNIGVTVVGRDGKQRIR